MHSIHNWLRIYFYNSFNKVTYMVVITALYAFCPFSVTETISLLGRNGMKNIAPIFPAGRFDCKARLANEPQQMFAKGFWKYFLS